MTKKNLLPFAALIVASACMTACAKENPMASMPSPPIFDVMEQCDDLPCLAEAAKTCTPAVATFLNQVHSGTNASVYLDYRVGVQGPSKTGCMVYHKVLSTRTMDGVSVPSSDNYASCVFRDQEKLSAYLARDQFVGDLDLMSPSEDEDGTCERMTAIDTYHPSVDYMLASEEWVADADESFLLTMKALDPEKSVTLVLQKGFEKKTFVLLPGEKKSVLGYDVSLGEFGYENTGSEFVKPAATVTVSMR